MRQRQRRRTLKPKVTVDMETRSTMPLDYKNGDRVVVFGHFYVGDGHLNAQIETYAHAAGLDEFTIIHVGDLVHGEPRK